MTQNVVASTREWPTIRGANLLYLATLLVFIIFVSLVPLPIAYRLVINQLLILSVLVIYFLITKLPLRTTLRLNRPGWRSVGLSLVIGAGMFPVAQWMATSLTAWLEYEPPLMPGDLLTTAGALVWFIVGVTLLAPIVEELLFRGVIQSAYMRRGPIYAIVATTILFAVFHMDPIQSLSVIPLGAALGYVLWRTNSVFCAIFVHLANNAFSALLSTLAFLDVVADPRLPPLAVLFAFLVALIGLWLLTRVTAPTPVSLPAEPSGILGRAWSLVVVALLFAFLAGSALVVGTTPQALSFGLPVELDSAPWITSTRWTYTIQNAAEETVGAATCTLEPEPDTYLLRCTMQQEAYTTDTPVGFFSEGATEQEQEVRWDRQMLQLQAATVEAVIREQDAPQRLSARLEPVDEGLRLMVQVNGEQLDAISVPDDVLLAGGGVVSPLLIGEWPWRLSALPFAPSHSRIATIAWPYHSRGNEARAPAVDEAGVIVRTADELSTPLGDWVTWRVDVGDRYTAWYTVDAPHTLVGYSDDMVTWLLTDVEALAD